MRRRPAARRSTTVALTPALDLQACLASSWHLTPDLWLRAVVVAGLLLVAGWVGAQRFFPGQRSFVGLHAAMVLWLLLTMAERAAGEPACKATLAILAWPDIVLIPLLWALFLYQYARSDHRPMPASRLLALAAPVLVFGVASLSNGMHGLLFGPATHAGAPVHGAVRMHYDRGLLFWLQAAWSYGLLLYCAVLVLRALRRAEGPDRRQWQGFLAMTLVPWVTSVAYLGFDLRLFGTDATPLSLAAAVAGMAWLIGRNALFQVVPLARRLLFTELPDPVLILDAAGRVMEANAAALALARAAPARATPLAQWPRFGAAVAAQLASGRGVELVTLHAPTAIYEMRVRAIGAAPRQIGQLVQLRDVTEQQQAQARIVQTLAERNAQLSQVASLQQELREQALRDPLTGLYNRRALAERYAEEQAHRRATGQPLALVVIDIDHFKRINDAFGHAAGDRVLCGLAREMRNALRASDTVYRTGGEEFALLMPHADADNALRRVETLRQRLAAADLGLDGQGVTFSAGVAAAGPGLESLDALLHAADGALYAAKAAGRNCSRLAEPPAAAPG